MEEQPLDFHSRNEAHTKWELPHHGEQTEVAFAHGLDSAILYVQLLKHCFYSGKSIVIVVVINCREIPSKPTTVFCRSVQ